MPDDGNLASILLEARKQPSFPAQTRQLAKEIGSKCLTLLLPQFGDQKTGLGINEIEQEIAELQAAIDGFINLIADRYPARTEDLGNKFIDALTRVRLSLIEDAEAIFHADPAADSIDEVILSYPGFLAIAYFRIAHELLNLQVPLLPRLICQEAHHQTGIDINPGAKIGRRFSIDHGTGVVIGETCVIGNGVKLFQGVTLGALAVERTLKGRKRHPTIGDNVVIYANATILGGKTTIGHDSIVGGNAWITSSVPPFSMVNRQSSVKPRSSSEEDVIDFMI